MLGLCHEHTRIGSWKRRGWFEKGRSYWSGTKKALAGVCEEKVRRDSHKDLYQLPSQDKGGRADTKIRKLRIS